MSKNEKKQEVGMFGTLPKLAEQKPQGISLVAEYWTPEKENEEKRVYVVGVREDVYEDEQRGEIILPCVIMIEETETGHKVIKNGAKRLVAAIESGIETGAIVTVAQYEKAMADGIEDFAPTGLLIKYEGEKKNKKNAFKSHNFDVRLLSVQ